MGLAMSYLRKELKINMLSVILLGPGGLGKTFLSKIPLHVLNFVDEGVITEISVYSIRKKVQTVRNMVTAWQDTQNTGSIQKSGIGKNMRKVIEQAFDGTVCPDKDGNDLLPNCQCIFTLNHRPVVDPSSSDGLRTTRRSLEVPVLNKRPNSAENIK